MTSDASPNPSIADSAGSPALAETHSVWLRPLKFGSLSLKSNLFLSPLAGYTTQPFRITVRELGGLDLCTTDLVNVKSLLRRNPIALRMAATSPDDSPLAVQLFGADPVEMRDAAQMLEESGVDSIDINMGCPVDKVVRTGSGSLLMTCHQKASAIVEAMASAVEIPITAKMRLGWDSRSQTAPELARALEGSGIAAVFVHGRTREQGFSGGIDLPGIAAVVRAVKNIPVIGNGDVTTPEAALFMFERTECSGVSIGRGAFYNPWIFSETAALLSTGATPPEPGFEERVAVMSRHLDRMIAFYGERRGCIFFRKVAAWCARRLGPSVFFRRRVSRFETRAEFEEILVEYRVWRRQFLDEKGELLPRYRPAPQHCSLFQEEREVSAIAVPHGPNAVW